MSQVDFAKELGVDSSVITAVENLRSPLRYKLAWKLFQTFNVGCEWLATGEGWQSEDFSIAPSPDDLKITGQEPFAVVYANHLKPMARSATRKRDTMAKKQGNFAMWIPPDAGSRVSMESELCRRVRRCMEELPDERLVPFCNALMDKLEKSATDQPWIISTRRREMEAIRTGRQARALMKERVMKKGA